MRILIRTSKWAIWARRLGSFALPLALIPVLMHRGAIIPTATFGVIEVVAVGVALLGLIASIGAFVRIWVTGDRGWGRAAAGCGLSLLCLAPPALLAVDYALYPMSSEVSTDLVAPPPLLSPVQPAPPTAEIAARIALAFPNVKSRNYPLAPDRVFAVISQLVAERGWEVLRQDAPDGESGAGQINAIAMTLFGFRDEVSVRLNADADGTSVAMRSVSLTPLHEPGVNGSRVEAFLTALDDKITRLRKDAPAGTEESDDDSLDATPAPLPSPRAARP